MNNLNQIVSILLIAIVIVISFLCINTGSEGAELGNQISLCVPCSGFIISIFTGIIVSDRKELSR